MVNFFELLKLFFFCFVVALSDLVHNVVIQSMLTANSIRKSFLKYDACGSFMGITCISEKIF